MSKHEKPPGFETPAAERMVDAIARAVCSTNCAYRGVTPCWSVHTHREDAQEWPNPNCSEPGCLAIATEVYLAVVPRGRR